MSATVAAVPTQRLSVIEAMASRFGMMPKNFEHVLRNTVVPSDCSPEEFASFLLIAREHNLNPVLREIHALKKKGGGIQPIVGVDGWVNLVQSHPQSDGVEFEDVLASDGRLVAIKCRMFRKDRAKPTEVIEYMSECKRDTDPWRQWPARMLRHKAFIQAARYAFGFSGIVDPDEYERGVGQGQMKDITPQPKTQAQGQQQSAGAGYLGGDDLPDTYKETKVTETTPLHGTIMGKGEAAPERVQTEFGLWRQRGMEARDKGIDINDVPSEIRAFGDLVVAWQDGHTDRNAELAETQ